MKNNKSLVGIIFGTIVVMLDVIIFLTIKNYNAARIINIIFLNLTVFITCCLAIINNKEKAKYLSISKYPILFVYMLVSIIINLLFIVLNLKSTNISIITQVVLLGILIICLNIDKIGTNVIGKEEEQQSIRVNNLKKIKNRLNLILKTTDNYELRKKIKRVYDVANSCITDVYEVEEIDSKIIKKIDILEDELEKNESDKIDKLVNDICKLLEIRNSNRG